MRQCVENVRKNANWQKKDLKNIEAWLASHK